MSGEFGTVWGNSNSYLWQCLERGTEDYTGHADPLVNTVGKLLDELAPLVTAIAYWQACDSSKDYPVRVLIERIENIEKLVKDLNEIQEPYSRLVKDAVKKALSEAVKE